MSVSLSLAEHDYDFCLAMLQREFTDFSQARVELLFPAEYRYSKTLRDLVSFMLEQTSINSPWNRRFALITDELVNNSIEHGSREGDVNTFVCDISTEESKLNIKLSVSDSGHGPRPLDASAMRKVREEKIQKGFLKHTGTRGRGLFQIIENLVDALEFEDSPSGGLTVSARKTFAL
ncbi:MAG TPA: ATP-binding protein [bacterium]|nr:ATP-binding protein [bacterium]